jgi:hypothetical protein
MLIIDIIFINSFIFFDFTIIIIIAIIIILIEENIVKFFFEIIFEGLYLLHILIIE